MSPVIPREALGTVFHAVTLLTPYSAFTKKVRVGRNADGGYVMLSSPDRERVLSYGVGNDFSFELALAEAGHTVHMADGSVSVDQSKLPGNLTFRKVNLSTTPYGTETTTTIQLDMANFAKSDEKVIVQMDIEGAEFDAIMHIPDKAFERISQLVFEIHYLTHLNDPEYRRRFIAMLERIQQYMTLVHVHANNSDGQGLSIIDGLVVSQFMELTFVKNGVHVTSRNHDLYPQTHDYPNCGQIDKPLWFYPFMPTNQSVVEFYEAWKMCVNR